MNESRSKSANNADGKKHVASRRAARAASDAVFASMDNRAAEQLFARRGFSHETIKVLIAHGLLLPEELLFMPTAQINRISVGTERTARAEIRAYRKRFLGENK